MDRREGRPPQIPAWAETTRRHAIEQSVPRQRQVVSHAWLDEPWDDLVRNRPGEGLLREAARRRRDGGSDHAWRVGADGEDTVATALRALVRPRGRPGLLRRSTPPSPWRVLHSVKIGAAAVADIDHIVFGPIGVLVVNAKQLDPRYRITIKNGEVHSGKFPTDFLRKADEDARRASSLIATALGAMVARRARHDLPDDWDLARHHETVESLAERSSAVSRPGSRLPVLSAVVFVGSGSVEQQPSPVLVTRASTLVQALLQRPRLLTNAEVLVLHEVARRSTTWTRDVPLSGGGSRSGGGTSLLRF